MAVSSVCGHPLSAYCMPAPSLAGCNRQAHRQLRLRAQTWQGFQEGCLKEVGRSFTQTVHVRRHESQAGHTKCVRLVGVCAHVESSARVMTEMLGVGALPGAGGRPGGWVMAD